MRCPISPDRSTSSLRYCEAHTQENKKCTGCLIKPLPDRLTSTQSFAECGRKARKNSATLGFNRFVKTPCRKAAAVVRRRKLDRKLNSLWRSKSILIPRNIRYAPPSNLIALKVTAEVARIAESPSAAAQV